MTAVSATRLSKRFGGTSALDSVELSVAEGSCHALMGENGAGKSTLAKVIAGITSADSGTLSIFGIPTEFRGPHDALEAGIAIVHQELLFCENLSVAENLALHSMPRRGVWANFAAMRTEAVQMLAPIGPEISPDALIGSLSIGQQQIVQIAGAIGRGARIILFDEPTSSLGQSELERFFAICDQLRAHEVTCIFVSHRLPEVFRLCDSVTVLRDGKSVFSGSLNGLSEADLVRWMVGREVSRSERAARSTAESVLSVKDLRPAGADSAVTFEVCAGEIVGFAGLIGSGRSEVAEAIFGLRASTGTVTVRGKRVRRCSPGDAMKHGVGLVPEDRKNQGLAMNLTVQENMALASLHARSTGPFLDLSAEGRATGAVRDDLGIRTSTLQAPIGSLSGGNQQKVVLGKWILCECDVLILDEPTRGVDVGAKAEIHAYVQALASKGRAIMLISSELPELIALCDRILVLRDGGIVGELKGADATEEHLIRFMTGVENN